MRSGSSLAAVLAMVLLLSIAGANSSGRHAPQSGNTQNVDKDSEAAKLTTLTNEWTAAINRGDGKELDALMSPDFALHHWSGELAAPRSQWLDNLLNHIKIQSNTLTDLAPQVYGDVGIVTSMGDWVGSFESKPFSEKCIVVDTWRKTENQWKVARRTSHCYAKNSPSGVPQWEF